MKGKKCWFHFRSHKIDGGRLGNSALNSGKGNPQQHYINNIEVIPSLELRL